jgi:thiamine pyrophosphokinase
VVSGKNEDVISREADEGAVSPKNGTGYIEVQSGCKYFSLLAAGGDAHGVTIRDAKYNIEDADLFTSFPLGVSNEVPEGNTAKVSVREGRLFVITVVSE